MNTAEMYLQAQKDGKYYHVVDGEVAYQRDIGLVYDMDFGEKWELASWDCRNKPFDSLMSEEWKEFGNAMTKKEAELKFNIKIID